MENQPTQLDPQLVNLAKSIRKVESNDNFTAPGKSGEYGAYQFTQPTWEGASKKFGVNVPLNQATPEQQNEVAYKQLAEWKKDHPDWNIGNFASAWNAGSGRPDAYKEDFKGINKYGVSYDTPAYAEKVAKTYHEIKGSSNDSNEIQPQLDEQGYATKTSPAPVADQTQLDSTQGKDDSLGSELKNRVGDIANAVSDTVSGKQGIFSGVLQAVGGIAGGLGDIVNKGIELIPGVKQVEGLIGQGIGSLSKTNAGQAVAKSIKEFSDEHPELAKDIGAGFNIVTALPILRGIGVVGKLGMEAGSQALKGIAEKSFINGAPDLIATTKGGANFLERNPTVLKDMVDRRLVGDIKGGEYVTKDAINTSSKTIGDLNNQVKTILEKPEFSQISQNGEAIAQKALQLLPDSGLTPSELISNARKLDPVNKLLWDKFEAGQANLQEINKLRSALDGKVKKVFLGPVGLDSPEIASSKELGASLSNAMRDTVQASVPESQPLFKEMSTLFNIQKALGYMDGKVVKPGSIARLAGHAVGTGAGGITGGLIGGPTGAVVGSMVGDKAAGVVAKKLAGRNVVQGVLKRTGSNAVRVSKNEALRKLPGLFGGAVNVKSK